MADALYKTTGDPATPGYRPLPGSGPTRGADLRTTVYAGLGIALGILAGTFVADGTVQRMLAGPQHQVAQVRPQGSPLAPRPSMTAISMPPAVSTPQTIAAATPTAVVVPAVEPPHDATAVAVADARPHPAQPVPAAKLPPATRGKTEIASVLKAPLPVVSHPAFTKLASSTKDEAGSSAAHKVAVAHHRRSGRRAAPRRVHLSRRHGRRRHRLHPLERVALPLRAPAKLAPAALAPAEDPAGFTVEGNLTVSSFDPSRGIVQTYEGESFALGKPVSGPTFVSWPEYPADLHYRCDQSGNCTLAHGRVLVASAKRTK